MTLPDLTSAKAKIARAREHMVTVKGLTDAFLKATPSPYELGRRLHTGGRVHEYYFSRYTTPPVALGLVVGDAVHNLRSALDHIAFSCAQAGAGAAGVVMTETDERLIQYPVCDTPGDFRDQVDRRLLYVKPGYRKLIEMYQPFRQHPEHPERAVPRVLTRLDNTDKHRVLVVLSSVINWTTYALPPGVAKPHMRTLAPETWGEGVSVATFTFAEPQPDLDLELSPRFTLAIDGGWPPNTMAHDVLELWAGWIEGFLVGQIDAGVAEAL